MTPTEPPPGAPVRVEQPARGPDPSEGITARRASPSELAHRPLRGLSRHFDGWIERFARDALAAGGEAWVVERGPGIAGVLLFDRVERLGSVFAADTAVGVALSGIAGDGTYFVESLPARPAEAYTVFSTDDLGPATGGRFRHRVRVVEPADLPQILPMLSSVLGPINPRGLSGLPPASDRGFVVEIGGSVAGAAWVATCGAEARFHSLAVSPPYRGLGVGADLWAARKAWAWRLGARRGFAEISERNAPSRRLAERAGLRPTGTIYAVTVPAGAAPQVRGAPQFGQTVAVESMSVPQ